MNHDVILKEYHTYPHLTEMSEDEKMQYIQNLSFLKKFSIPDLDSSILERFKNSIRGMVTVKKGHDFNMQYGDAAFLCSGAMYMYQKINSEDGQSDAKKKKGEDIRITCLLNNKIYGNSEVPLIPNNSYIDSLKEKLSFREFIQKSNAERQRVDIYAAASRDTELIVFNLQRILDIPYVINALNHYLLEFSKQYPRLLTIGDLIREEKSLSPLYQTFPGLAGEYTLEELRLFFGIPFGTWRRYL